MYVFVTKDKDTTYNIKLINNQIIEFTFLDKRQVLESDNNAYIIENGSKKNVPSSIIYAEILMILEGREKTIDILSNKANQMKKEEEEGDKKRFRVSLMIAMIPIILLIVLYIIIPIGYTFMHK